MVCTSIKEHCHHRLMKIPHLWLQPTQCIQQGMESRTKDSHESALADEPPMEPWLIDQNHFFDFIYFWISWEPWSWSLRATLITARGLFLFPITIQHWFKLPTRKPVWEALSTILSIQYCFWSSCSMFTTLASMIRSQLWKHGNMTWPIVQLILFIFSLLFTKFHNFSDSFECGSAPSSFDSKIIFIVYVFKPMNPMSIRLSSCTQWGNECTKTCKIVVSGHRWLCIHCSKKQVSMWYVNCNCYVLFAF